MTADTQEQPGTELVQQAPGTRAPLALHNGVIAPDRWAMFGRMAHVVANTDFAPKGMRGKPDAILACLMYGDSLALHPSVSLTDIFIVDGKPGVSGALMLAKIRESGHKVSFETLRADDGTYIGSRCIGTDAFRPLALTVQTSFFVPKSAGTLMVNTPQPRRGSKCVGCPRSGPPGSTLLLGPTGTSIASLVFRLKYPTRSVNDPSAFLYQPSYTG